MSEEQKQSPTGERTFQKRQPRYSKLEEIHPGSAGDGSNVYLRIEDVKVSNQTKWDNTNLKVAEGLAGDETAVINFRVVGDDVDRLKKGAVVCFRNLRSEVIQGKHRLALDKWGRVTDEPEVKIATVNTAANRSAIEYEKKIVPGGSRGGYGGRRGGDRRGGDRRGGGDRYGGERRGGENRGYRGEGGRGGENRGYRGERSGDNYRRETRGGEGREGGQRRNGGGDYHREERRNETRGGERREKRHE